MCTRTGVRREGRLQVAGIEDEYLHHLPLVASRYPGEAGIAGGGLNRLISFRP